MGMNLELDGDAVFSCTARSLPSATQKNKRYQPEQAVTCLQNTYVERYRFMIFFSVRVLLAKWFLLMVISLTMVKVGSCNSNSSRFVQVIGTFHMCDYRG
jgi:hypothetical protein